MTIVLVVVITLMGLAAAGMVALAVWDCVTRSRMVDQIRSEALRRRLEI